MWRMHGEGCLRMYCALTKCAAFSIGYRQSSDRRLSKSLGFPTADRLMLPFQFRSRVLLKTM